jgi:hypothetical protein
MISDVKAFTPYSRNGGSPTALLPMTTSGYAARSSISTLNTSGTSDHDGSL